MWTQDERNVLKNNYYMLDPSSVLNLLPGYSWKQIQSQVHYLKKRGWAFKRRKAENLS